MWIECVRLHFPPIRLDGESDGAGKRQSRRWTRRVVARVRAEEALIVAIYEGLVARGLLAHDSEPTDRRRRRVGYVVRDALDAVRRKKPRDSS